MERDIFGAEDFCTNCRVCSDACPPDAINDTSNGYAAWSAGMSISTNASRSSPTMRGCGACIAVCPGRGREWRGEPAGEDGATAGAGVIIAGYFRTEKP